MITITSGIKYIDIDGLASALAYRDLLRLEGKDAEAVLAGPLNHTVTKTIKDWSFEYFSTLKYIDTDFVIVDVTEASHLPKFVDQNRIIEIYDHHFGFKEFWQERLGHKAVIEPVGACATLIWEQYKKRGQEKNISTVNAKLLAIAIVSNTLNFKASITGQRDEIAFEELQPHSNLHSEWIRQYFEEQEDEVLNNPILAINGDTKVQNIPNLGMNIVIGQIELWDGGQFVEGHKQEIKASLSGFNNENWFFNCPSINEGKSYIYTENNIIKNYLENCISAKFDGNIGVTPKLWLRKEILNELYGIQQGA